MRRRRWARGGRLALLLASLTVLLTGCSTNDIEKHLRFGWPTGVTKQGHEMRVLWTWSGVAALALGVVVWGLIFWCCIRYRKKDDNIPRQTKYNLTVEMVCFVFPFIVIGVLFWRTAVVEDDVNKLSASGKADVYVQVDAFKWNWEFEYHDVNGVQQSYPGQTQTVSTRSIGKPKTKTIPLYLNTVGSDTEIPVLVIPVNQTVQFDEHSFDVIHAFWVPEFLFKRDVIPFGTGDTQQDNKFEITATTEGSFVGRCAELCGTYHSEMNFEVRVVSESTFKNYLAALKALPSDDPNRQATALAKAGMKPYATTTYPFDTVRTTRAASTKGS